MDLKILCALINFELDLIKQKRMSFFLCVYDFKGAYRDDNGKPVVLECVREAERRIAGGFNM